MPLPFRRTLRFLDRDRGRASTWVWAGGLLITIVWVTWMGLAEIPIRISSDTMTLTAEDTSHSLDAPVGGRVQEVHVDIGDAVDHGGTIVTLDTTRAHLEYRAHRTKVEALQTRQEGIQDQIKAEERAMEATRQAHPPEIARREAERKASAAAAEFREELARATATLGREGAESPLDTLEARSRAEEAIAEARSDSIEVERIALAHNIELSDRQAKVLGLKAERRRLSGELQALEANIATLRNHIDRKIIRAPRDGVVGDMETIQPGSVLELGERIGSVVAEEPIEAEAWVRAEHMGRIDPGQPARVRFDAFPWTEFGMVEGEVRSVSSRAHEGRFRLMLTLNEASSAVPLQHGLVGEAQVEVERASPAQIIIRTVGRALTQRER